jgi:GTP-sensing pleiotropic transcriptional regulator CodY
MLFDNEQSDEKDDMPKADSRANVSKSAKAHLGRNRVDGYVHVISPATVSEIDRAVGIKRSHVVNILRAFAEAGIKV